NQYSSTLLQCSQKTLISGHSAFSYWNTYSLHAIGITNDPEEEPTLTRINAISEKIKSDKLTTIYQESGEESAAISTLAQDNNITIQTLHTLENEPENGDYISTMKSNLETLQQHQQCTTTK
ncbi:MAG: zinc ABC transporter substrate-binding protein, partial [Actinomycetaceae bacterium]|nr:zinc ABC transporter substrate-binding protein [Actinomycetaceae bacterium]